MIKVLCVACACLLPVVARAGDIAAAITMTTEDAVLAFSALRDLGGVHDRAVKDGAQEHAIKEPYKFGPGLSLWIAHDIRVLRSSVEDFQAAAKTAADGAALLKEPITVTLYALPADQLQKDNVIPAGTLADLGPLLDDGHGALQPPVR